jgi:hypothetical protein
VLHLLEQNAAKGEVPTEPLVLHEESEADAG